jgi:phosphatidylinositol-3-phosphatase
MKAAFARQLQRATAAAASLTGKRFGLLVASSLVATSAIVAAAMTSSSDSGPLAALLGRSLAADSTPVASAPPATPETAPGAASESAQPAPEPASSSAVPLPAPAPAPAPEAVPAGEPEAAPVAPEAPAPEAGQIKHVFVISLASSGYDAAFGSAPQMPYLATTLRPQGDLLSEYSLLDKAALPNSVAALSGQPPTPETRADCPDYGACVYSAETLTLADQLGIAQFSWRAYMEGMVDPLTGQPGNCVYPQPGSPPETGQGGYAVRLNPFPYFHSLLDLGDCASDDVPFTELEKDLRKVDSTPSYSYVSPNLCDAGISGQCPSGAPDGAAAADAFLATLVPKILASPAYRKDGLLIVTFGQVNAGPPVSPATGPPAADPLKVGTLLVSPFVTAGATDAAAYDPYSLLRSTEDLFGLSPLAKAAGAKVKSFGAALRGGETSGGD